MNRRALIVGINYVGTTYQLEGCINDANNIKALLQNKGFTDIELLLEKDATTTNILAALNRLVKDAEPGDILVFHYSGHGSQIYSRLEEDKLDEIICPVDLDWKEKVITDNELKTVFNSVPNGVNITVILDCCHSGTGLDQTESATMVGTKEIISEKVKVLKKSKKSRYLAPPAEVLQNITDNNLKLREWSTSRDVNETALLIAGCRSDQTSADATIDGKPQGAATAALISVVKADPEITYQGLFEGMTRFMEANGFSQRPELDGSPNLYDRKFLDSWSDIESKPENTINLPVNQVSDTQSNSKNITAYVIGIVVLVALIMFFA